MDIKITLNKNEIEMISEALETYEKSCYMNRNNIWQHNINNLIEKFNRLKNDTISNNNKKSS